MTPSPSLADSTGVHDYLPHGAPVAPPDGRSITTALLHHARHAPDRPYLTWCPAGGGHRTLTYRELEHHSRRLAALLTARLRPGSAVALLPGNDIPSVVAVFAALRAGTPCLFLNPSDPARRLATVLGAHPVGAVLCSPYAPPHARRFTHASVPPQGTGPGGLVLGDDGPPPGYALPAAAAPGLPGDGAVPADRTAFVFGTSGSTAASKLVAQPRRAVSSNAEAVRRHHRLDGNTVLMGGLPLHHVNGVHFTLMAPALAGAHVVLPQELSPFGYRDLLDAHRPHLASVVPPVLEMLLATGRGRRPPDGLRSFVSAAAPLGQGLLRRFTDTWGTWGIRVLQGYGLSETTNFSTTVPPDVTDETYRAVALDADIPSVGVALHGNEVEVFAPDGTVLGEGRTGEIRMRGHNVMTGYAGRPDLTSEAFAGGWFHSGDLGHWATGPDGRRYYYLTGRAKNVAKVRGESVSLEEVERALLVTGPVTDAACFSVPHPQWGEQLVAVVAAPAAVLPAIRAGLAALLPPAALPTHWHAVDHVPRTATGKLRRAELAERFAPEHFTPGAAR
ncbi:class I adenylate-forming enzyme family protein [Streptomyces sp. UNOC14_S4]|uniref:class I adenylate-forming enzyme family protein n=1 Tax=Streptomyces sp. UNOC14_S4 TaxID=2872340 RepID=UPI001E587929|nr:class I adenylate-forming enzyme family protein [Streptomyces sp. UNOC14_S4]MCC3771464.1 acyl--CoA ligase [Streptomyces sp. UNOC14_S4]